MDLPYKAEYAKSGRTRCRGCKTRIAQGTLRLAVMVPNPEGENANWFHFECFFKEQRPKTVDDIENFESLRLQDQDGIKERVGVAISPEKKGRNCAANDNGAKLKQQALTEFSIEYSKSNSAMCRRCKQKIKRDEVRISKKNLAMNVGRKGGGRDMWHHMTCFAQVRSDLGYFESGDKLPGFERLDPNNQREVKMQIPAIKQEIEDDDGDQKEYRKQNKGMFKYRDQLSAELEDKELHYLLGYNRQELPDEKDGILDRLADVMTFGAVEPCTVCKGGKFIFSKIGYTCVGDLTESKKCTNVEKEPKRKKFEVPSDFAEKYGFLAEFKCIKVAVQEEEEQSESTAELDESNDVPT